MSFKSVLIAAGFIGAASLSVPSPARADTAYLPSATTATVSVIDTTSHQLTATIPVGNGPLAVAVTSDGATVLVTNQTDNTVSIVDGTTNTVKATVAVGHQPNSVVLKPDASSAYVVNGGDSTLSVINLATNTVSATIPLISRVGNVPAAGSINAAISPDGSRVYVMNTSDESVSVVNTATNSFVTAINLHIAGEAYLPESGIGVSLDGKTLLASNGEGYSVIDTATNLIRSNQRQSPPNAITFSPDGTVAYLNINAIAVVGAADGLFRNVLAPFDQISGFGFTIESIALTPDGRKLFFTSYQNDFVGEMDVESGQLEASIPVSGGAAVVGSFIAPAQASPLTAAVLPGGRAVTEGTTATVFATLINSGSTALSNCAPTLPLGGVFGFSFHYQTTNRLTNVLTGQQDTPVTLAANGSQTFILSFATLDANSGVHQELAFSCADTLPAAVIPAVNTVDLLVSATPVADVIALAATESNDGIVDVPLSGSAEGAFAVATFNNGAAGLIIPSVDTGDATLPITATICQTDPTTAQCLAAPASSISVGFPANSTPTFSIFVKATGAVPFSPATSRVFVHFNDSSGVSHGITSVAVRTTN